MESPMKYPKTKRNGVLFVFLNIITLSIFSLFVLGKVRKEVNSFAKGKLAPYWAMWLLGFITLGLAPLIWCACLARRVNDKAEELGVNSTTSFANFFNWAFFGDLIVVGPFIAFGFLFASLNRVEIALNELELAETPEHKAVVEGDTVNQSAGEEDGDEQNPAPVVEEANKAPSQPAEDREEKTVSPEPQSRPQPQPRPVYAPSQPAPASRPGEARIRFVPGRQAPANSQWRVCIDKKNKKYRVFATQAEAIAFATKLAASRGVGVKVAGSVAEKPQ